MTGLGLDLCLLVGGQERSVRLPPRAGNDVGGNIACGQERAVDGSAPLTMTGLVTGARTLREIAAGGGQ